ncbi:glycosyltransferase [Cupriavidus sp. BIC8F]|uniref:glycosyltransferase n=1 Tax=Cupriavidus sp. BIC8F TaxID=3079014 RepID=UPI0029168845|nr:glycosyltransferase [Cupriavidus sp. BIC8F]
MTDAQSDEHAAANVPGTRQGFALERPTAPVRVLIAVYVISGIVYFSWRSGTVNSEVMGFSLTLYAAELFGFVNGLFYVLMTFRLSIREAPPPWCGASVDVFVPTYDESAELVRRTLLAAKNMQHPHVTWLLDDGNRDEMRKLAAELHCKYLARVVNANGKAGNLNHALQHSRGEFVAIFDTDHAPRKDFLSKTLGYFRDPEVAFVQTPQDFYNIDAFSHRVAGEAVWSEQSVFYKVIQRGKDTWNASFLCGSCVLLRRSALNAVGGFAVDTVTEDIHTSIRLHKKGFRSVYHAESLAYGLAPHNIDTYLSQRIRWGTGAMQVLRQEGVVFTSGLTLAQRLNYLASMLIYFEGWQKLVFFMTPPAILIFGVLPIVDSTWNFFAFFSVYYLASLLVYLELGRGFVSFVLNEQYGMARFFAFMLTITGLFRRRVPFSVTCKDVTRRGRTWLWLAPSLGVGVLNFASILVGIARMALGQLPLGAGAISILWAGMTVGTAILLARFSLRVGRRAGGEYRFPLRIPLTLTMQNQSFVGLTVDLSASSALYRGEVVPALPREANVDVEVHLPNAVVRCNAAATFTSRREVAGQHDCLIELHLQWTSPEARRMLDTFLFGSSLQFEMGRLRERQAPPLTRLARALRRDASLPATDHIWEPGLLSQPWNGASVPIAVAYANGNTGHALSMVASGMAFDVHAETVLRQRIAGRQSEQRISLSPAGMLETPTGAIHLYSAVSATPAQQQ